MPRLRQALHLARTVARHPDAVLALARWRPFSITSFAMARALHAQGVHPAAVIDAGANVGQFARAMVETFPEAVVHSFEPLPSAAVRLRGHLGGHPRVQIYETALGSTDGTLTFYPQAYDLASSALPPSEGASLPPTEVPVARLDTAFSRVDLPATALLKLDLQGFELEALRGAPETLGRVRYVLLEASFRQAYAGEPPFEAVYAHLRGAGFRFLRPVDVLTDASGEIVQMDALFERLAP